MYAPYQPNLMGDILYIKISVSDSLAKVNLGLRSALAHFKWALSKRKTTKDSFALLGYSYPDK